MPDGKYRLGNFDVQVTGGVVRNSEGKLAGSALTLDRALRNIVALGVPLDLRLGKDGFTRPISSGEPLLDLFG